MKKAEIIAHWGKLAANQAIEFGPVAYKHEGSTFDEDSIRITGSRDFIDSVLSRIKDVLEFENGTTRLQLSYQQAKEKNSGHLLDSYCCYIQVHERGPEAQMMAAFIEGARERNFKRYRDKAESMINEALELS